MVAMFPLTNIGLSDEIGVFESGSPEWHELRAKGVGGSQVGSILGLSPWESAYTAWAKATGLIQDSRPTSLAMRMGNLVEPIIRDLWQEQHPDFEIFTTGTFASRVKPWQHANPDGLVKMPNMEWALLEIKMSRYGFESIPPNYEAQMLWYCRLLGLKKAFLVVLVGGAELREFVLEYDEFKAEAQEAAVERWWNHVQNQVAPEWDGSESTFETVRALHPDIEDRTVELGEMFTNLVEAIDESKVAEEQVRFWKSQILDRMGSAKDGLWDGRVVVRRVARGGGSPYLQLVNNAR